MKNILVAAAIAAIMLSGCSGQSSKEGIVTVEKDCSFEKIMSAKDSVVENPVAMDIEAWTINDLGLVCQSSKSDTLFHVFDPVSLSKVSAFGVAGSGPDEYGHACLLRADGSSAYIVDEVKNKMTIVSGDGSQNEIPLVGELVAYNLGAVIKEPYMGFMEYKGNSQDWFIKDFRSGVVADSISIPRENEKNRDIPMDYRVATNGKNVVIAFQFVDECRIVKVGDDGKIESQIDMAGDGTLSPQQPYYVDVDCGDDRFFLLSMKNVKFGETAPEGAAEVEIYSYDGKPLGLVKLDFIPMRMKYDQSNNRLIMLSTSDEDFHLIPLDK